MVWYIKSFILLGSGVWLVLIITDDRAQVPGYHRAAWDVNVVAEKVPCPISMATRL